MGFLGLKTKVIVKGGAVCQGKLTSFCQDVLWRFIRKRSTGRGLQLFHANHGMACDAWHLKRSISRMGSEISTANKIHWKDHWLRFQGVSNELCATVSLCVGFCRIGVWNDRTVVPPSQKATIMRDFPFYRVWLCIVIPLCDLTSVLFSIHFIYEIT